MKITGKKFLEIFDKVFSLGFLTMWMFLPFCVLWMELEKLIYGTVQNRLVDNIVAIPILISFWFNAKYILEKQGGK